MLYVSDATNKGRDHIIEVIDWHRHRLNGLTFFPDLKGHCLTRGSNTRCILTLKQFILLTWDRCPPEKYRRVP
jgi:hypothetical protein